MTKDIFSKITIPQGILAVNDLTPDEKKQLYAEMQKMGSSENFAYKRFFKEGFSQWEIEGVLSIKLAFLSWLHDEEKIYLEVRNTSGYEYRHFYRIPPKADEQQNFSELQFDLNAPGDFWRFVGDIGYRKKFGEFLYAKGMKSYHTVMKRFEADDWREWEKIGIREVTKQLFDKYGA